MDIKEQSTNLKFVNSSGSTLGTEEKMQQTLAANKLQAEIQFDEVFFWGRLTGTSRDYYIMFGLHFKGYKHFPKKSFFWW